MSDVFRPSVTVAAIVYQEDRFLLVRERTPDGIRINQPAGHLERGESLMEAVVRETREETGYLLQPTAWLGSYMSRYSAPKRAEDVTYVRFAFVGTVDSADRATDLDPDIVEAVWMDVEALRACTDIHRSPLVWQCVEDYLARKESGLLPLAALYTHASVLE